MLDMQRSLRQTANAGHRHKSCDGVWRESFEAKSPNSAMPVVIVRRGIYLEDVSDFTEMELSRAARVYE